MLETNILRSELAVKGHAYITAHPYASLTNSSSKHNHPVLEYSPLPIYKRSKRLFSQHTS